MFLLSRFGIHSDTVKKKKCRDTPLCKNKDSAWTTPSRLDNAWFSVVV
jgi:hypothetical protein